MAECALLSTASRESESESGERGVLDRTGVPGELLMTDPGVLTLFRALSLRALAVRLRLVMEAGDFVRLRPESLARFAEAEGDVDSGKDGWRATSSRGSAAVTAAAAAAPPLNPTPPPNNPLFSSETDRERVRESERLLSPLSCFCFCFFFFDDEGDELLRGELASAIEAPSPAAAESWSEPKGLRCITLRL